MDDALMAALRAQAHTHPLMQQALERIECLQTALQPFASIGLHVLEVQAQEPYGFVWGGGEQRQALTVWFGPSDFGHAITAMGPHTLPIDH